MSSFFLQINIFEYILYKLSNIYKFTKILWFIIITNNCNNPLFFNIIISRNIDNLFASNLNFSILQNIDLYVKFYASTF